MNCSPPGSIVHGILQARILDWVAISFSKGSFPLRNRTHVSCVTGRFYHLSQLADKLEQSHAKMNPWIPDWKSGWLKGSTCALPKPPLLLAARIPRVAWALASPKCVFSPRGSCGHLTPHTVLNTGCFTVVAPGSLSHLPSLCLHLQEQTASFQSCYF